MRRAVASTGIVAVLVATGCAASAPETDGMPSPMPGTAFSAVVADKPTGIGISDGDLWPSCWSGDGALYTANGDGAGFGAEFSDIVMNRVTGTPASDDLTGEALAIGDGLGQVWSGDGFSRKPTGMLCTGRGIYLAVQDLALDFNSAPAATIARSDDHGRTWMWDRSEPMFDDGVFTTIWFADYGQDSASARDSDYAYAYGLDGNWRDSFSDAVPDPTEVFLARVPVESVQDAATWEFYAGDPGDDDATWTDEIADKRPVLVDDRRQYSTDDQSDVAEGGETVGVHGLSVISQGGVTYLPKRDRYLYTSWTEFTFEFYESPTPWGPWTLFLSEDFGEYPWNAERIGGYGTTIPSKFISEDETTMWVQSNVCPCAPAGTTSYWFGLREMTLGETAR